MLTCDGVQGKNAGGCQIRAYLNDREAQDRSGNVADPHAKEHGDEHVGDQHDLWLVAGFT